MAGQRDPDEHPYGWVVAWACFTVLAVVFGASYAFAAFFESLQTAFAARRADVSLVFGLSGLLYFVLGAGAGILADRFGPRAVVVAGMLCVAAGLAASSWAPTLTAVTLLHEAHATAGDATHARTKAWLKLDSVVVAAAAAAASEGPPRCPAPRPRCPDPRHRC